MKRHSIKKASTFKLQAEKSKFVAYLEQIENCKTAERFPQIADVIPSIILDDQVNIRNCF